MASFYDLTKMVSDEFTDEKYLIRSSVAMKHFDLATAQFSAHMPHYQREVNDEFYEMNKNNLAVMDFDKSGFTEPEDETDCFLNNLALSHLSEAMPHLEKMNQYLTEDQLKSDDYSLHTLHLITPVLQAEQQGMSQDRLDFMIEKGCVPDYQYFGCKPWEYGAVKIDSWFLQGLTKDEIESIYLTNPDAQQAIDFYIEKNGKDNIDALKTIGKAKDMGIAYGTYDIMCHENVDQKYADMIVESANMIHDACQDKNLNVKTQMKYEDGTVSEIPRFSTYASEGWVTGINDVMDDFGKDKFTKNKLKSMTYDFIHLSKDRFIQDYAEKNKSDIDTMLKSVDGDLRYNYYFAAPDKNNEFASRKELDIVEVDSQTAVKFALNRNYVMKEEHNHITKDGTNIGDVWHVYDAQAELELSETKAKSLHTHKVSKPKDIGSKRDIPDSTCDTKDCDIQCGM